MENDLNYELIARYIAGECNEEESAEIESRLKKNPEQERLIKELQKIWYTKSVRPRSWDVEATWKRLSREMEQVDEIRRQNKAPARQNLTTQRFPKTLLFRVAAIFMVVGLISLFGVLWFGDIQEKELLLMKEVITEKGQRAEVRLDDGSRVSLNADSKIEYLREFEGDNRTVDLTGEAYFEIVRDGRPFFVYADEAVIEILGTEFNVQAYQEEKEIQVVVADGEVSVRSSLAPGEEPAVLEQGEMASLTRDGNAILSISHDVELQRHLGWLDNRIFFDETALEHVIRKLERLYGIDIRLTDSSLAKLKLTATFEDESIHEVLRVIEIALELEYEFHGRTVLLSPA